MKKNILAILLLSVSQIILAQDYKGDRVILSITTDINNVNFYPYTPSFKAKAIYKDTSEVTNNSPEELMMSVLSSTSYSWDKLNELKPSGSKSKQHYDAVAKMNRDKNYFELIHKFEFMHNGNPTVLMKFYLIKEKVTAPIVGVTAMTRLGNKWYVIAIPPGWDEKALLIMRFKSDKLLKILNGTKDGEPLMVELIEQSRSSTGGLDFDKLVKIYSSWYGEVKNQKMIDYFTDTNSW
ncbi:MAG: hypothetical protein K2X86_06460 [Cytophagaceae bacterium]|nr:hypothetical protein [Cytophagaceae bacterium]